MEKPELEVSEEFDGEIPEELEDAVSEVMEIAEDLVPDSDFEIVDFEIEEEPKEEPKETTWEDDGDATKFVLYLRNKLKSLPPHSGQTTVGCERAISYLKKLDKEISKAIQEDDDNVIDEMEAENLREMIHDAVSKLERQHGNLSKKRSDKYKKEASVKVSKEVFARIKDGVDIQYYVEVDVGGDPQLLPVSLAEPTDEQVQKFAKGEKEFVKEAKSPKVVLFEDPFLHAITRVLINAHVSAGRNIGDVYDKLKAKYSFTPREELSIQNLLLAKGIPMFKDFGRLGEDADPADGEGVEFSTTYYS